MIAKLVDFLNKCSDAYYNSDEVLVTNDTYDAMVDTLRKLDPTNPYLTKVGSEPRVGSNKVGRLLPMGTLTKLHTNEEVKAWLDTEDCDVILAPKYDGFGVELLYDNCHLVMASTRGSGYTGEDVTEAILRIPNIPVLLPETFKDLTLVRGEAIIPRKYHDQMKSLGYSAMRNAVPGIVRSNRKEALGMVDFVAYEFFDGDNDRVAQRQKYSDTFNVEHYVVFHSSKFDNLLSVRDTFGNNKDSYDYEIDGTVLKTVSIKEDDLLQPKHSMAWKFKSNRRETILRNIEFQLGVTGKFTPIGIFDEVEFQGAKLSRASLGSMGRYYDLKPCIGDTVEVSRRGDIIPMIEDVSSYNEVEEFITLDKCPHCGEDLVLNMCINTTCPEKLRLQIMYYVGTIGVKGIGPALVRGLVDKGVIKCLSDIYYVKDSDILSLPRQGQSSVDKWNTFVNKELTLIQFLSALPFDNIGVKAWESIVSKWKFDEIMNLRAEDLYEAKIRGFGESKIQDMIRQLELYKDEIVNMYGKANVK